MPTGPDVNFTMTARHYKNKIFAAALTAMILLLGCAGAPMDGANVDWPVYGGVSSTRYSELDSDQPPDCREPFAGVAI